LSGRGLCDELITRPEESYRLCCVVVCDLETSRIGAPYIYDISRLRVKMVVFVFDTYVCVPSPSVDYLFFVYILVLSSYRRRRFSSVLSIDDVFQLICCVTPFSIYTVSEQ